MEKTWRPEKNEKKIAERWEKSGIFTPRRIRGKKPFTILLPPPNANDPLHIGHAMYVVEDILCRYHRMKGEPTLFLPGTDHAGIETQYVFEKKLQRKGKSRFDYDRETLYQLIEDFVNKNRGIVQEQLRRLGFSLDWTREVYTLDPKVLTIVFETFRKLCQDGLIYREERLVNFCTHCGTGFSNLEVKHVLREDKLYFLDYETIKVATVRPETIFADVAVAVNPKDKRYQKLVGQKAVVPIINKEVAIVADAAVNPEFGTGALKITPGHDFVDFEVGQRHGFLRISVIDREGRMSNLPRKYLGLPVEVARAKVVKDLQEEEKLVREKRFSHSLAVCYRCRKMIEPLLSPQWYLKVDPLVKKSIEAVEKGKVKLFPKRFKKELLSWLGNLVDWNISRQIVWGPRIPAWYCLSCNENLEITFFLKKGDLVSGVSKDLIKEYKFEEIEKGLQNLIAPVEATYQLSAARCENCGGKKLLQETDTFDTWFSSGQWPLTTLKTTKKGDFEYFYPTSVLDTMWDILPFWVMRMIMLSFYRTGKVPFDWVHMHSRVNDAKGRKMSKSLGNVIDPLEKIEEFGADALRMALVFGVAPASEVSLGEEKLRSMRNFANKIWNMGRYIEMAFKGIKPATLPYSMPSVSELEPEDQKILRKLYTTAKRVSKTLKDFKFHLAAEGLYNFAWHEFADVYLEKTKERVKNKDKAALFTLRETYLTILKLLHPFAPFVTEAVWQIFRKKGWVGEEWLATAKWPTNRF